MKSSNNRQTPADFNLEDTGRLMTQAAGGGRRKRVILIAAAAMLVIVVALLGYRMLGDSRYDSRIRLAENALREGNYEQAEEEYLAAIALNDRKTDARRGLAFTYALEEKYEEAADEYEKLYEDTGDDNYREAIGYVEDEELPLIDDIFPSPDIWIFVDHDRLPAWNGLVEFIENYLSWTEFESYLDRSGDVVEDYYFSSEEPADSYAFQLTHGMINEWVYPGYAGACEWMNDPDGDAPDPRGWAEYGVCQKMSREILDEVYCSLFNVDSGDLDEVLASAENRHMMYLEDGYYYMFEVGAELSWHEVSVSRVVLNGSRVFVEYTADLLELDGTHYDNIGPYYAEMKLRMIDGRRQWTMIYNGPDVPEEIRKALEDQEENGGADNTGNDQPGDPASFYQPVIDEYRDAFERVMNGEEIYDDSGFEYAHYDLLPSPTVQIDHLEYAFKDIDGNGIAELVIGSSYDGEYYIGAVLTLDQDNEPVELIYNQSFMYRADLYVFADGTISYGGSSGADDHRWTVYRIDSESSGLEVTESYEGYNGSYNANGSDMTQEDFYELVWERLDAEKMAFDWNDL